MISPITGKANNSQNLAHSSSIQDFYKKNLEVGIGACIVVKVNLDVKDGLANGAMGTVVKSVRKIWKMGNPK